MQMFFICINFLSVPVAPPVIEMQIPKRVILTRDESLLLTCNTTNVNGEIKLNWVTPPGSVRPFCFFSTVYCAVGVRIRLDFCRCSHF